VTIQATHLIMFSLPSNTPVHGLSIAHFIKCANENLSKTHSETELVRDHPVRAFSERDHFLDGAATPPWQGGEIGNMLP
jgi:hypothetical protein